MLVLSVVWLLTCWIDVLFVDACSTYESIRAEIIYVLAWLLLEYVRLIVTTTTIEVCIVRTLNGINTFHRKHLLLSALWWHLLDLLDDVSLLSVVIIPSTIIVRNDFLIAHLMLLVLFNMLVLNLLIFIITDVIEHVALRSRALLPAFLRLLELARVRCPSTTICVCNPLPLVVVVMVVKWSHWFPWLWSKL